MSVRSAFRPVATFASLWSALGLLLVASTASAQCVSLTTLGSAYTQNFDTLSNTAGSTTNNLTITGWFMTETGGGARDNEQYAVDTGGSNTGDTYSYGSTAATDRALGSLRSGTLIASYGSCYTNNTGATISSLDLNFFGEEWRLGTTARTDQLNFEYSLDATSLTTGVWTNHAALNFVTPETGTTGAKDGNAAANRTSKVSTIPALSIANGATFWIRMADTDASGADDGLAIDDFNLTPQGGPALPNLSISDVTQVETNGGTTTFTFAVTLSAPAGAGGVTFDIATADGTAQDDTPATEDNDYVAQSLTGQSIPMGSTGPYNFSVTVNGDAVVEPNETFFVNVTNVTGATVLDGQGLGTITNDDVAASADVSMNKTLDTAGPYVVGQSVTYTLTVANAGPSTATNIQVTDTPTNLSITSVSGSGCASLPCTIPSLASSANTAITVTATITAAGAFDNIATATATETDPVGANNTDSTGNGGTAAASADISLSKTLNTVGPFTAGQTITYTITVANAGPSAATAVTVTDTPTNLTITSVSGACVSFSPCVIASIASGANAVITVNATINSAGAFDNSAAATAAESDPVAGNNTDNTGNNGVAGASADVSLSKTLDTAGPYTVGQSVTYTLTVANAGPSAATNIQVTDTPTNLTITSVSGSGCASLPCTIPSLASGANTAITVTATINAAGLFDNTANASATEPDPISPNNTDDTGNAGTAGASADVSLNKTLNTAGPYFVGQSVTYTLTVANAGPSTATGIQVTDTPTNLTITSVSGSGCAALPCTIASLASGANTAITVTATITAAGAFDNSATATAAESDPNIANNTDSTGNGGTAAASADVSISKTLDTAGPYIEGQAVTYTLTVANAGPSTATNIQVTDTPTNLTITSVSGSGCVALPCTIPSLASGANTVITVTATITAAGAFDNSATATAAEADPDGTDNTDSTGNGGVAGVLLEPNVPVPTLSWFGLALLLIGMLAIAAQSRERVRQR